MTDTLPRPDDLDGLPTCAARRVGDRCVECSDGREEGAPHPCPALAALDGLAEGVAP